VIPAYRDAAGDRLFDVPVERRRVDRLVALRPNALQQAEIPVAVEGVDRALAVAAAQPL